MRISGLGTLAVVLLAHAPALTAAAAEHPARTVGDRLLRVEWDATPRARSGQVIRGYVTSDYGIGASNIRLVVESLDRSGAVASSSIHPVPGTVPPLGRMYYEIVVNDVPAAYRVRVLSWDWVGGGGL